MSQAQDWVEIWYEAGSSPVFGSIAHEVSQVWTDFWVLEPDGTGCFHGLGDYLGVTESYFVRDRPSVRYMLCYGLDKLHHTYIHVFRPNLSTRRFVVVFPVLSADQRRLMERFDDRFRRISDA